jgi:16S rRNA processing protein RimM
MLLAGQIGKPHGTAGDVYVVRISDDPHRFDPGARLVHEDGRELIVVSARPPRDRFLVRFEGTTDREGAEALRGSLFVPAEDARTLEEGEFWPHELEGFEIVLPDGTRAGVLDRVQPAPAQDLFAITTERGERLVPYVADIVLEIDTATRGIVIDPP